MAQRIYNMTTNDFIYDESIGKYVMHVTDLGFTSVNFKIEKLIRSNEEDTYKNIIPCYEILADKTLKIYSDVAFAGRLVVATDA